jgi:uncharacterized protein with GYD domain
MLFCIEADYTPAALTAMRENPSNRSEAVSNLCEAAGGKLVAMYGTIAPGAMAIVDFDDESNALAIVGVIASSGQVQNVRARRLLTMDDVVILRQKGKELAGAYKAPGQS